MNLKKTTMKSETIKSETIKFQGKEFSCSLAFALQLIGDKYQCSTIKLITK